MVNPLLSIDTNIPFDSVLAEHIEPAVAQLVEQANQRLTAIGQVDGPRTYENTLSALEKATEDLGKAMTVVSHLKAVATYPELQKAHAAVLPAVSALYSSIPTNSSLWNALQAYSKTEEAGSLDGPRKRFLEQTLREFRRHGAELSSDEKATLAELDTKLTDLTNRFSQNVLDATNAFELYVDDEKHMAGLPESARNAASESAKSKGQTGYRFTLQAPSLRAVLTYLDDRRVREQVWTAYSTRAADGPQDNRPIIREILGLRRDKAKLLGFKDFSDLVLGERMAKNGEAAQNFVKDLSERSRGPASHEHEELQAFRKELEGEDAPALMPWDTAYYAEKMRRARLDLDSEMLRPYFPLQGALAGAFQVAKKLYGVDVRPCEMAKWHPDVHTYALYGDQEQLLGTFYADLHPRETKRGGAWMNALITGIENDPHHTHHVGLICANFSPPTSSAPALLNHRELETLFHEFGHLLHHLLTNVQVPSLAGTNVAWDFVELPSQIMENWCWERDALALFAKHYESGESIPDSLMERLRAGRTFRSATQLRRQMSFATVDLALHRDYSMESTQEPHEFALEIFRDFSFSPLPDDYAMIASFHHLFSSPVGYAAGYYSYAWAAVLDADAFSRFQDEGIFNRTTGDEFRRLISSGDSQPPELLFQEFMKRAPSTDAYLRREGLSGS